MKNKWDCFVLKAVRIFICPGEKTKPQTLCKESKEEVARTEGQRAQVTQNKTTDVNIYLNVQNILRTCNNKTMTLFYCSLFQTEWHQTARTKSAHARARTPSTQPATCATVTDDACVSPAPSCGHPPRLPRWNQSRSRLPDRRPRTIKGPSGTERCSKQR